jgi:hypothetical protein
MAFVRTRTTKAGMVSTALVESYRDAKGRPRQRVLANLYGCSSPLEALAKLALQRQRLRKEKADLAPDLEAAAKFYEHITLSALEGRKFSTEERRKIDPLLRKRKRMVRRAEKIDGLLSRIKKDGAVIQKHCEASQDEIQAAIRTHKESLERAESLALGFEFGLEQAKRDLRRLSLGGIDEKLQDDARFVTDLLRDPQTMNPQRGKPHDG